MKTVKKVLSAISLIGWFVFPIIFKNHFNTWSVAPKIVLLIIVFCSDLLAWSEVLNN